MARLQLWRLKRERKSSEGKYSKYIGQAADADEKESRIMEWIEERERIRDKILHLRSMQLSATAEDLGIPVPPLSDKESWEEGRNPGTVRLTLDAQSKLRQAIRVEQREKWSVVVFLLKEIIVPLIGILGAIMGLLSVIHALRSK